MNEMPEPLTSRLTLRQLKLILAVARHRNIQRAAKELGVTQPTATKSVREAERTLGVDLFERTNRGVVPTPSCAVLTQHARLVFAQLRNAGQEMKELQGGTGGRIIVGSLLAASARLLPEALARLKKERPRVSVTVLEGTNDLLMPALRNGEIDFVAGRLPEFRQREGIAQEPLYTEIACFVVRPGHPLASRASLALADLSDWTWVLPRPETTLRRQIDKAFHDAGLAPPQHPVDSVSLLTNLHLTLNADFISVWPYQVARSHVREGRLAVLPIACMETVSPVGVSRRLAENSLSPAADALMSQIRAVGAVIRGEEAEWRSLFGLSISK